MVFWGSDSRWNWAKMNRGPLWNRPKLIPRALWNGVIWINRPLSLPLRDIGDGEGQITWGGGWVEVGDSGNGRTWCSACSTEKPTDPWGSKACPAPPQPCSRKHTIWEHTICRQLSESQYHTSRWKRCLFFVSSLCEVLSSVLQKQRCFSKKLKKNRLT